MFPKWAWSWSREQFLHCRLRKFLHSKSSVYRWYTQLDRRRFVYDTCKAMKATRTRHGWVPTLSLQLHNFDLFRTCRTRVSALLRGNRQDFNWHDASHGPSAIAELLVIAPHHLSMQSAEARTIIGCEWSRKENISSPSNCKIATNIKSLFPLDLNGGVYRNKTTTTTTTTTTTPV